MRLLRRCDSGDFSLSQFSDKSIPPYAILSHTWGADNEEVTFKDLTNGAGRNKPGYKKIRFCGGQAAQDSLEWFWIDTCCIDKTNKAELSHAIRSMFRWYQNATRCYVYLADVPRTPSDTNKKTNARPWEVDFRESRWFTRGWTLQELIAPRLVEFFSYKWERLGDKVSLERLIYETTSIPYSALQGAPLSQFSVNERLLWREHRQTKLEEDAAYSLLGIFDVYIAPIYGEGTARAFKRLIDEINKLEKCIQDLRLTDPCDDKKRIEDTKGGLLEDSYYWILQNPDFQQWHQSQQNQLLWIKGDPGKGKTMLLCGIIDELNRSVAHQHLLAYFFCQATDARINNAIAVLRGLLYLLVRQRPSLVSHIRKKYDHAGISLFKDANAWIALREIFENILQDPSLSSTYLIIDALDECETDLPKLLDFIAQQSSASRRVKWIVSSRNWPDIEERLARAEHGVRLSLELNAESVSAAVGVFVEQKVLQLAQEKKYDSKTRELVERHLLLNADGTFLWVALVCQDLKKIPRWMVRAKLTAFPPGLDPLYRRMLDCICNSEVADLCKWILASMATVYRPVTLQELASLVELLDEVGDLESLQEVISLCGSFLIVREGVIYFVHQSAKDFLLEKVSADIFPSGREEVHHALCSRSLQAMSTTLQRDMYRLGALGYPAERVEPPDPDPLAALRYPCIYWIDHLCDWNPSSSVEDEVELQDRGAVNNFLRKQYLYWLEALSLCKSMSKGVTSVARLEIFMQRREGAPALNAVVRDARQFIMSHKLAIEKSPLQAYTSALLFSPTQSLIRDLFKREEPDWITTKPAVDNTWSPCMQTLEGHSDAVRSVAFSHDSARVASASGDSTVKIWDASSGECLSTLEGHSGSIYSAAFSHDSTQVASASVDKTVRIWDASSGECLSTLQGHSDSVYSVAFSHDSTRVASASGDNTVKIWDATSGECLLMLEGHSDCVNSVAFSHDSTRVVSASGDSTVKIWDTSSGECLSTLEGHNSWVTSVAFSYGSTRVVSASLDNTVKIWDANSGECLSTLQGHSDSVYSVAFSHDSARVTSASWDKTVKIWDASSGECLQTLNGHSGRVNSVAFSHDSTRVVSASRDSTVKIWNASSSKCLSALQGHSGSVYSVALSHDSARVASASGDSTIKIWDASSGECLLTLQGHSGAVLSVTFSHGSTRVVSASGDSTVKIWDANSGECLSTHQGHSGAVLSVAFSHDSTRVAAVSGEKTVKIWDTSSGECLSTLQGHSGAVLSVAFSHDSTRVASASLDSMVKIWDTSSGACLSTLEGHSSWVKSVAFSHDSAWVASASHDKTVKIWDASSSECLQTLNVDKTLYRIAFDVSDSYLKTDIGTIDISALSGSVTLSTISETCSPRYQGLGLSADGVWITHDSQNLIWLPSEYRPSCSEASRNTIGIGVGSGRVWICKVDPGISRGLGTFMSA